MSNLSRLSFVERFLFLLLYCSLAGRKRPEPITGDIWLQKEIFAISNNVESLAEEADFEPLRFGAHSSFLDELKNQYINSGFIKQFPNHRIKLTPKGMQLGEKLWKNAEPETRSLVFDMKSELNDMTYDEILLLMYVTFPDYTVFSDVKEKILRNRVRTARQLFKRQKVSLEKASQLAGLSMEDFLQLVKHPRKSKGLVG